MKRHFVLRGLVFAMLLGTASIVLALVGTGSALAQPFDQDMEAMLKRVDLTRTASDTTPVPASTVSPVNVEVHWRLWKRVQQTKQPGIEQLTALRHDAHSLGHRNLPVYAFAILAMTRDAEARGELDPQQATEIYRAVQGLAPDLPYPFLAHGAYMLRNDLGAIPAIIASVNTGVRLGFSWLDTGLSWRLKLMVMALLAFVMASLVFLFVQLLRYFGIIAYDTARILPRGFSSSQTVILVITLVVVPGLIMQSPLLGLLILLALVSVCQQSNERIITIMIFGLLTLFPTLDEYLSDLATFPDSPAQQWMHAQYLHCDDACIVELESQGAAEPGAEPELRFTYLLAKFRKGDTASLAQVEAALQDGSTWPTGLQGHAQNLLGAILVAQARPAQAFPVLEQARASMPESAAPAYNIMRAYQMSDQREQATNALAEASSRDLRAVLAAMDSKRRDVNSYLLVAPLPLDVFWRVHQNQEREHVSLLAGMWRSLAGEKIPMGSTLPIGIVGIVIVLAGWPLRRSGRTSTPCPKCGLARDPGDSHRTGHHHYCLPCYRTFVSGSNLDYNARLYNEKVLGRRERLQQILRRGFSLLLPGTGHSLAGHTLLGFGTFYFLCLATILLIQPMGIWRPPYELFSDNWLAQRTLAWIVVSICVCIGLNGAFRDIEPTQLAKRPAGGTK